MSCFDLIGKKNAQESVLMALRSGRLSHAILLTGDKGVGKKTFADFICALLTCKEQNAPCRECPSCKKVQKGIHPDIYKIYPAGKSETIGVKEIKPIKENLYIKPNDAECKIFIIYEADRMNKYAQNAMLKMIEEPPEDSYFIFTLKNSSSLLSTVRSRTVSYNLAPATVNEALSVLKKRFENIDEKTLSNAAELSRGNIGLGIEIVENPKLKELYDDVLSISKTLFDKDRALLTLCLGPYSSDKNACVKLAEILKLTFRDAVSVSSGNNESLSGCTQAAKEISKTCSANSCLKLMGACDKLISALKSNANLALAVADFEINLGAAVGRN